MFNLFNKKIKKDVHVDSISNNNIVKKTNTILNFEKLLEIDNENLNTILRYVSEEPIFFEESMRLISKCEIQDFEEEYQCKMDGLIPLIDIFNNDFVVYNCNNDTFGVYNIVDELIFNKNIDIDKIINQLKKYCNDERRIL